MDNVPDRFGPYIVSSAIGSGGMGEVFRARDSRLNRDVAIKILARTGIDPARQQRFTGEAQAASALNHPNIVTVYDVGDQDGVRYIVSELVDGTSVRALVARAPLPLREVLDLSVQMAEGLAAAHQAGIVHRDFKPENVMVTREGRVKILDFGLALVGTREGPGAADAVATLTNTGAIVGTVPYMSPEQAAGEAVDYHTDQFSLGLTLYELLTGRRAFQSKSDAQTLAAIIEDEPEPLAKLNPRVPAPLRWAIERCLAKDPRQRYESTTDLARELRTLKDRLAEFGPVADVTPAPAWRFPVVAATTIGAAAVMTAAALIAFRTNVAPAAALEQYRYTPFATDAGYQSAPAWSPDGKTLAYVAAVDGVLQVFTKALGSPFRAQLTRTRFDCTLPFWAPDQTRIYYISQARTQDGLWSISAAGGLPELVMENVTRAAISPDGRTLALIRSADLAEGTNSLWLASPAGSPPALYSRAPFGDLRLVDAVIRFSPDGSKLGLWGIQDRGRANASRLNERRGTIGTQFFVLPLGNGTPRIAPSVTVDTPTFAAPFSWLPDNRHIVSVLPNPRPGTHLWVMDTEGSQPQLITAGKSFENDPDVSADGTRLAMSFQEGNYDVYKLTIGSGAAEPVLASSRNEMDPAWSPATSQLAFTTDRTGTDEIWLRSANGDFERPLVTAKDFPKSETYILASPAFSPDGQRVAYYRESKGQTEGADVSGGNAIWIAPVAGGPPVQLGTTVGEQDLPSWSPDGNWIAFSMNIGGVFGKRSLVKMRVGATVSAQVLATDIAQLSPVKWAPNGAWIAHAGIGGLSVVSPDGQTNRVIAEQPWMAFDWSEDSRQLTGLRLSDDFKHLTFASVDVESRAERVHAADFLPLPVAARPVRGFTRTSPTTFLTSIIHVSSDIWLLDGFRPPAPAGLWDRLTSPFRPAR